MIALTHNGHFRLVLSQLFSMLFQLLYLLFFCLAKLLLLLCLGLGLFRNEVCTSVTTLCSSAP